MRANQRDFFLVFLPVALFIVFRATFLVATAFLRGEAFLAEALADGFLGAGLVFFAAFASGFFIGMTFAT
jgi:hypothetical protein